ncbi:MAG TPA: PTS glucose transporter subunit IIA, partial [Candidatus Agrococcus pullicola]|nr:PTS glucose transporter subunit IIA [Candidatus Agrococcus pullicola]
LNVQFVKDAMEDILSGAAEPVEAPAAANVDEASGEPAVLRLMQPIEGEVVPLQDVPDEAFSSGALGPGLAIAPTGDTVVAPADATVVTFAGAGHAIGLALEDGTELLIHVGIDTVKLHGAGFTPLVSQGDRVSAGTPLLHIDRSVIDAAGYSMVTPVVVLTNPAAVVEFG